MKKSMQVLAASSALTILFAMIVTLTGMPAHSEVQESGQLRQATGSSEKFWRFKDSLVGVWDAKVVITDCSSGNPLGLRFDSLGIFSGDGTFHDTNANNPVVTVRSGAFGHWNHVRGNKYRFAFKTFNFDMAGTYIGYQIVRHELVLARNGKSYESKGTSEFFNPDGSPRPPVKGCSETTATPFK